MQEEMRSDHEEAAPIEDEVLARWHNVVKRRAFLKGVGAAAAIVPTGALLASGAKAAVRMQPVIRTTGSLSAGDAAILRFLAAAEIIEADLWQQYNELGGVNGGNPSYIAALQNLDGDMPQYITDNTDDELSHAAFLNAAIPLNDTETPPTTDQPVPPVSTAARRMQAIANTQASTSATSSRVGPASTARWR